MARLRGLADGLSTAGGCDWICRGLEPETRRFPPPAARVVLNLLLLAAESLPGGGIVALSGSPARQPSGDDFRPARRPGRRPCRHLAHDEATAWQAMLADPRACSGAADRPAGAWPRLAAVDADAGRRR